MPIGSPKIGGRDVRELSRGKPREHSPVATSARDAGPARSNQQLNTPSMPRPAATVMLVRDCPTSDRTDGDPSDPGLLEVLMVKRNAQANFVAGAFVFPGGSVDVQDADPCVEEICIGRTDEQASSVLGIESGGLAYWVAAIRECFEEAGVLLAYDSDHDTSSTPSGPPAPKLLSLANLDRAARFVNHRQALLDGRVTLVEICEREHLKLAVDRIEYFSHWITPEGAPRRFDTRFFVAPCPEGQAALHDAGETVAHVWIKPLQALASQREGGMELVFPTMRSLEAIGRFSSSEELLGYARQATGIQTFQPKVIADGNGVRILLPGDETVEIESLPAGTFPLPKGGFRTGAL